MQGPDNFEYSYDLWLKQVQKDLKGADFERKLVTRLPGGLKLSPLYTQADLPTEDFPAPPPGQGHYTRGAAPRNGARWTLAQFHNHSDPKQCNTTILEDLACGVEAINLELADQNQSGLNAQTLSEMRSALKDIKLQAIALNLRSDGTGLGAALALIKLWQEAGQGIGTGNLGLDPLGTVERQGHREATLKSSLNACAKLATYCQNHQPKASSFLVDGAPIHEFGADAIQLVGAMIAKGVEYLRALSDADLSCAQANQQMVFAVPVGVEQFPDIALLRALRTLWSRVLEASGVEGGGAPTLWGETAMRTQSRRDPWVNMLRNTVATFSAAVGGADQIAVRTFDSALGQSDRLARRVARNTQWVLAEESHLAFVQDPAGGSFYVERLTRQLEEAGWAFFQQIEAEGGYASALAKNWVQHQVEETYQKRQTAINRRKQPITGVSEFANLEEKPVERSPWTAPSTQAAQGPAPLHSESVENWLSALQGDRSFSSITQSIVGTNDEPSSLAMSLRSLAEGFEDLRDRSQALAAKGHPPRVFLANLGKRSQNIHRATWARNFFAAGGVDVLNPEGFSSIEAVVEAFTQSDCSVAVICGSDGLYESTGPGVAKALRKAGAKTLYVAGRPGPLAEAWAKATVDEFIFVSCNVHAHLDQFLSGEEAR